MNTLLEKKDIFEENSFSFHFDRAIYINRNSKKIFSFEYIENNSIEVLKRNIFEKNTQNDWKFYFNFPMSESVKSEIRGIIER